MQINQTRVISAEYDVKDRDFLGHVGEHIAFPPSEN